MSPVFRDAQLDVELLIQEIKQRPCLYEKNHLHYSDLQHRKVEWYEITSVLYKDVWDSYDNAEKKAKCDLVQKRWKNLRACFTRECKRQKDPKWIYGVAYKRRKYIYFNELSFLKSECDAEETTIDIDLPVSSEAEVTTLNIDDKFGELIPDSTSVPKTNADVNRIESPSNIVNAKPITDSVNTIVSTNSVNVIHSTITDHSYSSPNLVISNIASISDNAYSSPNIALSNNTSNSDNSNSSPNVAISNITSNSDNPSMNLVTTPSSNSVILNVTDTDSTTFALSLVPMLNMLPIDDKVECQIKVLSAILPYMKKCKVDSRSGGERERKTATPIRQTYRKKRIEHVTVEIKSEEESDGDLYD